MILDTVFNDITSIKVLLINNSSTKDINHLLKKQLKLKELIPYFKNNNEIENKDDYTTFLNPSFYPESFIKFEYMKDSQDIEELLIYHDLEPWRNQLVVLTIEDAQNSEGFVKENVYHKTLSVKELSDPLQYYTICQNVFEILKTHIRSLSYMKLKSPNNFMIDQDNKITYLNDSKKSENSSTYYQITKAKYKINNMDLNIQLHSRKMKYICNILMVAGQYKKALELLDTCVVELYKNGDFLWLSNALEMVIFCLLNIVSISNDKYVEVHIPKCVDYLIAYDKHILIKGKVIQDMLKQVVTNESNNRESIDHELNGVDLEDKGNGHVLNTQSLVFLIVQIYEKLIHYSEYTYDEVNNYCTPNILNNFFINYLWLLHQSIVYNDMNQFLVSMTRIDAYSYDKQYLQPIKEDLAFQYRRYEKCNIFKSLNMRDSLSFMSLHLNIIDQLRNEKTMLLKFFYFVDKFKNNEDFVDNSFLKESVFKKLVELINSDLLENKLILKKLIVIIMIYCNNEKTKTQLASLSLQNHVLFNAEEQKLIMPNLKQWVNERNTCLLKNMRVLERSQSQMALPKIEKVEVKEQDVIVDEIYNPYKNKVYEKEKVIDLKHCFIENEVMSVEFTFNNYFKFDLTLIDVNIVGENFEKLDLINKSLIRERETTVVVKFKCLFGLADTYIDIKQFEFKFEEFKEVVIDNINPYEKNHPRNTVLIIPEIPVLNKTAKNEITINNDCINEHEILVERLNAAHIEVFDIKVEINDYSIQDFFNKKILSKSEYELYEYMLSQFHESISINHEINEQDVNIDLKFNLKDFKIVNVTKLNIAIQYGLVLENTKYISELNIPVEIEYVDSLIVPNFEILPFNLIPSEQISLSTDDEVKEVEKSDVTHKNKQNWITFMEKNKDYKWILLLNLRNVSSSDITLNCAYKKQCSDSSNVFEDAGLVIKEATNRKVMIPIEASLFDNISYPQKSISYNILMNCSKYLKFEYSLNGKMHELNLLSNLKLEDCYNSQKLVNRQDILISMEDGKNTFRVGESKKIRLEPKIIHKTGELKNSKKRDNILISLMVLDIITSEDVLEKENLVLINGMRTFNTDQLDGENKINVEVLFTVPGSYEINCLCEVGEDPSSVLKYFGTRALTVRVVE